MPAHVLKLLSLAAADTPDADLLARFVAARDGAAFAELVRRHGPGVYRVCRRLVGRAAADDAFQSTFLVLACRAGGVRKAASVGSWLVGVAGRVARQMRRRDRRYVALGADRPAAAAGDPTADLAAVLAAELARLPDALRAPVVLCLVEGRTQEQAAAALGGSVRTLRRRLDRARAVLWARLERRGVVPVVAAGAVAALGPGAAALPPGLADRTVAGVFEFLTGAEPITPAAVVAKGVVGSMVKLKVSALVAAAAAVLVGLGVGWAGDGPPPPASPPADPPAPARPAAAAPEQRTAIRFTGPAGMAVTWRHPGDGGGGETGKPTVPREGNFLQGQTYRLRLTDIKPDHLGKTFYPTLEVAPATPKTQAFLAHASVPVAFTGEDFDRASAGNLVVKVVYLPDPAFRDLATAGGAEEVVSTRLDPGADPVAEAKKRGTVLATVRLGNIDLETQPAPANPAPPGAAATHRTANFVVTAPTAVEARAMANEAEYQRKEQAKTWLGKELPDWPAPCPVRVTPGTAGHGGSTTFAFRPGDKDRPPGVASAEMELHGSFVRVLTGPLPHEVTHAVLATHFGKQLPRWADEGIALAAEAADEQAAHDARCRELLGQGRAIRLRNLFPPTEYPRDMVALYAQGHSVVRFLLAYPGRNRVPVLGDLPILGRVFRVGPDDHHRRVVAFVALGADGTTPAAWDKAAKQVYGFASVDELERAWIDWLKTPASELKGVPPPVPIAPKPADPDRIPPTKLSGADVPADAITVNTRTLSVPIARDPARAEDTKEVRLYVSRDRGATWAQHAVALPDQTAFAFEAPADGLYWLAAVVVGKDGTTDPADLTRLEPAVKLWVDTSGAVSPTRR